MSEANRESSGISDIVDSENKQDATHTKRKSENGESTSMDENEKRQKLNPTRCQFYLKRKQRYCRTIPPAESKYCVEHSHLLGEESVKKRIPCPLDPKHTCYESQLKQHLKKCNARDDIHPVYFQRNINSGSVEDAGTDYKVTISSVSTEEVLNMVKKVQELYAEKVPEIEEEIKFHEALREETEKSTNGTAAQKHLQQQASLVGHLDSLGLLKDSLCYIEFGAGKGGLSHWVQRALPTSNHVKFTLIEKGSIRYKMDSYHKGEDQGPSFERLRIDIEHLNLAKVDSLQNMNKPIVGIGKHLCGGATDLMLRCLMETSTGLQTVESKNSSVGVHGMVLALCCHHRCDWQSYVGKFFLTECGLGARELHLLASLSSWATCATRTFLNKLKQREDETANESDNNSQEDKKSDGESHTEAYNHPRYGSLTPEDREEIGYKCKALIDEGRVRYLRAQGYQVRRVKYISKHFSLENTAILVTRSGEKDDSSEKDEHSAAATQ